MKLKVKIDDRRCIGSGNCVVIASENFEINNQGKAQLKPSLRAKTKGAALEIDANDAKKEKLLEAAMACPAQAIQIVDENGRKIY